MSTPLVSTAELEGLYLRVMARTPVLRRGRGVMQHGAFSSLLRGHGLELADLRPYQWGDDPRHMDWRATARSGKPVTKVFMDERLRQVFFLVDRGPTMAFGTRGRLKAAMAVQTAAVLAFTALAQRETVGGALFDGRETRLFPAAATLERLLPMLHEAAVGSPAPRPDGGDAARPITRLLETLGAAVPAQASLFLISDFNGLQRGHRAALIRLTEHRKVTAIRVQDPAEQALPGAGVLRVASPLTGRSFEIDTDDLAVRDAYAAAVTRRSDELRGLLSDAGIPLLHIRTDQDPLAPLEMERWTATH